MSGVAVVVDSDGDDDDGDGDDATMTDDVARALPPTMVLETCLLGPLREHCRLASLSCLGVFEDELGVVGLAGVCVDREMDESDGFALGFINDVSSFRGFRGRWGWLGRHASPRV